MSWTSRFCAVLLAASSLSAGLATWYDDGPGFYAAAGPELRHGDWRGSRVEVCATACVTVTLSDWCACGDRSGRPTLLDLSADAFIRASGGVPNDPSARKFLSKGVIEVEVTPARSIPLPATDTVEGYAP